MVAVRRFAADGAEIAVFEFEGRLRDVMISSLRDGYLATGSYLPDSKDISSQSMLSMVSAGAAVGGTTVSAAMSSTLFMATANPASLMSIGAGVGSAVMGSTGIVAQAPFIAVASSLPVVAPIMAMQALNAAIMLDQFQKVDRKLNLIKSTLDTAIARAEATHAGELISASITVDEVYRQYESTGSFSQDMLIRLALAERDVHRLATRFRYLVEAHSVGDVDDLGDVQRANYDAHSAMLASFLELRIRYLRVCVDMQENAKSVDRSVAALKTKIEDGVELWQQLLRRSEEIRDAIKGREAQLNDMNWVERRLPEFAGGKGGVAGRNLETLRAAYVATMESERAIMQGFDSLIQSTRDSLQAFENPTLSLESAPTMVYWRDEDGEHSFYTRQLQLG
ncbi:MAG TPA: hypothetical protein DEB55_16150 [Microbacterium sp.]|nr:hypothetical protein [Microbacterium sp.]